MDRPALKVLRKILNEVCEHYSMDYKFACPKFMEELFEKPEYQEGHAAMVKMLLEIRDMQRKGDIKLLKAIFGEDFDVKEVTSAKVEPNDEEIEDDDEENDCNNCEECTFKYDCDSSPYYEEPYKARLAKEYWELVDKYEKLHDFINEVEKGRIENFKGSLKLLKHQAEQLSKYIETLQKRAVVENIGLGKYKENK